MGFNSGFKGLSSSLCSFLHSPVTSSLSAPNIPLSTLFPKTLSLRSSLNVSDQVSHPSKATGKTKLLDILILIFLDNKQKILHQMTADILHQMTANIPWFQSAFNFFLKRILIRSDCSQISKFFHPFKGNIITLYNVTLSSILISHATRRLNIYELYFFTFKSMSIWHELTMNLWGSLSRRRIWWPTVLREMAPRRLVYR